jgi:hypothetical protein
MPSGTAPWETIPPSHMIVAEPHALDAAGKSLEASSVVRTGTMQGMCPVWGGAATELAQGSHYRGCMALERLGIPRKGLRRARARRTAQVPGVLP